MKKKLAAVFLSILMLCMSISGVNASSIEVEYTDSSMGLSHYPYMQNGTLMVPLREMAENLNFLVTWNADENAAQLLKVNTEAKIYAGSTKSVINGEELILPCETVNLNGTLYCPVAFIKEISQLQFSWDINSKILTLLANSSEFNAFSFAKEKVKKRVIIKNPLDPSKFLSVEAASAYACYVSAEDTYVTDNCVVQECKNANGGWAYAKYTTKELKNVLSQIKSTCEIRFWAKTTSEEGNTVLVSVKDGPSGISYSADITQEWKEYSVVLNWNQAIDIQSAYALIGMKRNVVGEKVYIDGLSINPAE